MIDRSDTSSRSFAIFVARTILGLIFCMAGVWKVFSLGPIEHARRLFVEPYAQSFLPAWSLWATGTVTPVVELVAGALVLVGWKTRVGYVALGAVLVLVTFGHLVAQALYPFHEHVIPRTVLLLFCLVMPATEDRWSVDGLLRSRRTTEAL